MKKSILAIVVAALATSTLASSASATTVYDKDGTTLAITGRVQSVYYNKNASPVLFKGTEKKKKASLVNSGRLGVDVRTQLNNDVAAFGKMEWSVATGEPNPQEDHFTARYLWVGLDFGDAGLIKFGRFESVMKYAIVSTDLFDDWGGVAVAGNDDKRKSAVEYKWSRNGFTLAGSYTFANTDEHIDGAHKLTSETADLKYTVAGAFGYVSPDIVFGPVALWTAYEAGEFADSTTNITKTKFGGSGHEQYDDYDHYSVGLSWGNVGIGPYVGAMYHKRTFDLKGLTIANTKYKDVEESVSGYEFTVGYGFQNGVSFYTGYNVQNYEFDGVKVKAATTPVFLNWVLTPNFNVWLEGRIEIDTDQDKNPVHDFDATMTNETDYSQNMYSAGIRYQF